MHSHAPLLMYSPRLSPGLQHMSPLQDYRTTQKSTSRQPPCNPALLRLHLPILLHMNMVIRLQNANLVIRKLDREALDQRKFVLDLPALGLGLVFRFVQFLWGGILFEGYLGDISLEDGLRREGGQTLYIGILRRGRVERK